MQKTCFSALYYDVFVHFAAQKYAAYLLQSGYSFHIITLSDMWFFEKILYIASDR